MTTPHRSFPRQPPSGGAALSLSPAQSPYRRSLDFAASAPRSNPYDAFTAPQFDDFVGSLTDRIKDALMGPPKEPRKRRSSAYAASGLVRMQLDDSQDAHEQDVFGVVETLQEKEQELAREPSSSSPPPFSRSPFKVPLFAPASITDEEEEREDTSLEAVSRDASADPVNGRSHHQTAEVYDGDGSDAEAGSEEQVVDFLGDEEEDVFVQDGEVDEFLGSGEEHDEFIGSDDETMNGFASSDDERDEAEDSAEKGSEETDSEEDDALEAEEAIAALVQPQTVSSAQPAGSEPEVLELGSSDEDELDHASAPALPDADASRGAQLPDDDTERMPEADSEDDHPFPLDMPQPPPSSQRPRVLPTRYLWGEFDEQDASDSELDQAPTRIAESEPVTKPERLVEYASDIEDSDDVVSGDEYFGEDQGDDSGNADVENRSEEEQVAGGRGRSTAISQSPEADLQPHATDSFPEDDEELVSRIPYHLKGKQRARTPPSPISSLSDEDLSDEDLYDSDGSDRHRKADRNNLPVPIGKLARLTWSGLDKHLHFCARQLELAQRSWHRDFWEEESDRAWTIQKKRWPQGPQGEEMVLDEEDLDELEDMFDGPEEEEVEQERLEPDQLPSQPLSLQQADSGDRGDGGYRMEEYDDSAYSGDDEGGAISTEQEEQAAEVDEPLAASQVEAIAAQLVELTNKGGGALHITNGAFNVVAPTTSWQGMQHATPNLPSFAGFLQPSMTAGSQSDDAFPAEPSATMVSSVGDTAAIPHLPVQMEAPPLPPILSAPEQPDHLDSFTDLIAPPPATNGVESIELRVSDGLPYLAPSGERAPSSSPEEAELPRPLSSDVRTSQSLADHEIEAMAPPASTPTGDEDHILFPADLSEDEDGESDDEQEDAAVPSMASVLGSAQKKEVSYLVIDSDDDADEELVEDGLPPRRLSSEPLLSYAGSSEGDTEAETLGQVDDVFMEDVQRSPTPDFIPSAIHPGAWDPSTPIRFLGAVPIVAAESTAWTSIDAGERLPVLGDDVDAAQDQDIAVTDEAFDSALFAAFTTGTVEAAHSDEPPVLDFPSSLADFSVPAAPLDSIKVPSTEELEAILTSVDPTPITPITIDEARALPVVSEAYFDLLRSDLIADDASIGTPYAVGLPTDNSDDASAPPPSSDAVNISPPPVDIPSPQALPTSTEQSPIGTAPDASAPIEGPSSPYLEPRDAASRARSPSSVPEGSTDIDGEPVLLDDAIATPTDDLIAGPTVRVLQSPTLGAVRGGDPDVDYSLSAEVTVQPVDPFSKTLDGLERVDSASEVVPGFEPSQSAVLVAPEQRHHDVNYNSLASIVAEEMPVEVVVMEEGEVEEGELVEEPTEHEGLRSIRQESVDESLAESTIGHSSSAYASGDEVDSHLDEALPATGEDALALPKSSTVPKEEVSGAPPVDYSPSDLETVYDNPTKPSIPSSDPVQSVLIDTFTPLLAESFVIQEQPPTSTPGSPARSASSSDKDIVVDAAVSPSSMPIEEAIEQIVQMDEESAPDVVLQPASELPTAAAPPSLDRELAAEAEEEEARPVSPVAESDETQYPTARSDADSLIGTGTKDVTAGEDLRSLSHESEDRAEEEEQASPGIHVSPISARQHYLNLQAESSPDPLRIIDLPQSHKPAIVDTASSLLKLSPAKAPTASRRRSSRFTTAETPSADVAASPPASQTQSHRPKRGRVSEVVAAASGDEVTPKKKRGRPAKITRSASADPEPVAPVDVLNPPPQRRHHHHHHSSRSSVLPAAHGPTTRGQSPALGSPSGSNEVHHLPVTRSHCAFTRVSFPASDSNNSPYVFLVPECALATQAAQEEIEETGAETLGPAGDIESLEGQTIYEDGEEGLVEEEVLASLRRLVGPELMAEGICELLPREGGTVHIDESRKHGTRGSTSSPKKRQQDESVDGRSPKKRK